MQFTTQQLAGGARYSRGVRMGNWQEDSAMDEEGSKDFELQRQRGHLMIKQQERVGIIANQEVPRSFHEDGNVHFGDHISLRIEEEDFHGKRHVHFLACNPWSPVDAARGTVEVTCTARSDPHARNVFVIVPSDRSSASAFEGTLHATATFGGGAAAAGGGAAGGAGDSGDVLRYGDRFMLASNPSLRVDPVTNMVGPPFFLSSERPNNITGAGRGNMQEVSMGPLAGGPAQWTIMPADNNRLAAHGLPVRADVPVQLLHVKGNQPLGASIKDKVRTDFGPEITAHAFFHKPLGVVSDPSRVRPAGPVNQWRFVLAATPEEAEDDRDIRPLSVDTLIDRVKAAVVGRGNYGLRALARSFRVMDDGGDGKLDKEDFKWGLYDIGVRLTDEEFKIVLDGFDRNDDGVIDLTEFLRVMRGEMNEARCSVVREAYAKLDADSNGTVTFSDIARLYDASQHKEVLAGRMTEEQALREYMSQWDTQEKDGIVTIEEFIDYYRDISASIDLDEYFDTVVRQAWRLDPPGGPRPPQNKRVIVTFKSGRRQEMVIPGGARFADDDIRGMTDELEEMGKIGVATVHAVRDE